MGGGVGIGREGKACRPPGALSDARRPGPSSRDNTRPTRGLVQRPPPWAGAKWSPRMRWMALTPSPNAAKSASATPGATCINARRQSSPAACGDSGGSAAKAAVLDLAVDAHEIVVEDQHDAPIPGEGQA